MEVILLKKKSNDSAPLIPMFTVSASANAALSSNKEVTVLFPFVSNRLVGLLIEQGFKKSTYE